MANQVTLTFAGETKQIEDSFGRVGGSAKKMSDDVGESADGFKKAGEAADEVDTKAMGFRDTLTGVQDSAKGTSLIMKGDLFNGFLTLGAGIGDLGSGFYNLIIPALEKTKVATLASAAASKVAAAGSRIWAAAQWVMNSAMFASPITWVVVAIVALIAVIVLIATKTDWFSKAWRASWSWIKSAAANTWEFLKKIPGWIATAFAKVAEFISRPYIIAFNLIARAWNSTIGSLSWTVPDWIPGIGGNSISVPNLPTFHAGGRVPGSPGEYVPILAMAGERVSATGGTSSSGGGWLRVDAGAIGAALLQLIQHEVGRRGGRVTALGVQVVGGAIRV
jgi:hypothetical protein